MTFLRGHGSQVIDGLVDATRDSEGGGDEHYHYDDGEHADAMTESVIGSPRRQITGVRVTESTRRAREENHPVLALLLLLLLFLRERHTRLGASPGGITS